jgi:hypothetical protein
MDCSYFRYVVTENILIFVHSGELCTLTLMDHLRIKVLP